MRYIRFLKYPKCSHSENKSSSTVSALITITSDLGESFYPKDVAIAANLVRDENSESMGYGVYYWRAGMRSLQLDISAGNTAAFPVKLHVVVKNYEHGDSVHEYLSSAGNDIVSAWSEPLDPADKGAPHYTIERRFLCQGGETLAIREETGESIARHIWDAGLMLMSFLDRSITTGSIDMLSLRETLAIAKKKCLNCIELGTGCGVVGLGLAQALPNCNVLLTDLPEAEDIVKWNMLATRPASNTVISFEVVDWEEDLPISVSSTEFDLILVADCTYNPSSVPSLVRVLATLAARSRNATVLLAHKVRHSSEAVFLEHIADAGFFQDDHVAIPLPSNEGIWSPDDSGNVDLYSFHTSNRDTSPSIPHQ
ncbi:MAG: hypothetical protein M1840_005622 [Geoglossum simile]|nr:MAG: hypothetical protein M1840_005622 [Geoglossum simile]